MVVRFVSAMSGRRRHRPRNLNARNQYCQMLATLGSGDQHSKKEFALIMPPPHQQTLLPVAVWQSTVSRAMEHSCQSFLPGYLPRLRAERRADKGKMNTLNEWVAEAIAEVEEGASQQSTSGCGGWESRGWDSRGWDSRGWDPRGWDSRGWDWDSRGSGSGGQW